MPFGQIVIGPPGSGKTTYCNGMHHFLTLAGRDPLLVNLDPAAEDSSLPLAPDVDVRDLVCLGEVMSELDLGPNGGLVWCMEYVAKNSDWLREKISEAISRKGGDPFLIFDTPGQAELFSPGPHGSSMLSLLSSLSSPRSSAARSPGPGGEGAPPLHVSLAAVLLLDSHLCTDSGKYLAGLLTALGSMLHLELPQINVLSKIDNLRAYSSSSASTSGLAPGYTPPNARVGSGNQRYECSGLQFDIAHYASASGLTYLLRDLTGGGGSSRSEDGEGDGGRGERAATALNGIERADAFASRYAKLTRGLCDVIEDFGLLSFTPLAIEDEACVRRVATLVDRAVGWVPEAARAPPRPTRPSSRAVHFAAADRGAEALLEHVRDKYLGGGGDGGDDFDVGADDGPDT